MINSFLSCGEFAGFREDTYQWRANPTFEIMVARLNEPEKKQRIEEALTAASGVPSHFLAVDAGSQIRREEEASDEAYVRSLTETFGTEPVDVLDQLPSLP